MTLLAPLAAPLVALIGLAAAPSPVAGPPCAACVTWRAPPAVAARLLEAPGSLAGLDIVVSEGAAGGSEAITVARALAARGATVALEVPLGTSDDLAAFAVAVPRIVLRLPTSGVADDDLVFRIRTSATAIRAASASAAVGLAGPLALVAAIAARDVAPYVSFAVADEHEAPPATGTIEWWRSAGPAHSVPAALAETAVSTARVVLPLGADEVAVARAVAGLADLLPAGLTPLGNVTVCPADHSPCAAAVFLHPGTLEAIALVEQPALLRLRPGAAQAAARLLAGGRDTTLAVVRTPGGTDADARALAGPFVLHAAGWAGETGFTAGVEVTATRKLTVAEILAAHQAAAARQAARVRTLIASGTTVLTFQVPGLAAPMTLTADTVLFRSGALAEIEQRRLRLNGVPVAVGPDGVPRLPLVQPERVASPPLTITLGEAYRYRLEGDDVKAGRACYVIGFAPADRARSSLGGRAWIARDGFGLVRLEATQTGLRGAIVSSRQEDEFRAVDVEGGEAWLPARSTVDQVYEGPGHRTPIHRQTSFDRVEPNPPGFDARLAAARASEAVMMRETAEGFRYLRRTPAETAPVPPRTPGGPAEMRARPTETRVLAGSASRVWSVAAGALFDPNIDRPLPFAGLSYLDFDVLGTGAQMNAFLAGPFAQLALSVPSLGRGLQLQAWGFASLARYNDRSFRGGRERYDENLSQRPARASVAVVRRLGGRARLRVAYDLDAVRLDRNDTTAADFVVPMSPVAHGARLGLEWERGAWSAAASASASWRQRWRAWGRPGDFSPDARTYERAGLTLTRAFVVAPRAVARVEAGALFGRHLDRFSRFGFDAFDNRLRGYPSAGLRFDRGAVLRTAGTWTVASGLRLDVFLDGAVVRDPTIGRGARGHVGTGAAVEAALPGRMLLSVDWGFGFEARDRDGRRGTQVVRITVYKVL